MTKAEERKQVLVDFASWAAEALPVHIQSVLALNETNPDGLSNTFLLFVVPRAMTQVVEHSCLRVVEAWDLLNDELVHQRMRGLGTKNRDYVHLKRIRNKLVAHRVPNELGGRKHHLWYAKTYGTYESVLALLLRVATKLAERVFRLQESGRLPPLRVVQPRPKEVTSGQISDVLNALKTNGLY